METNTNKVNCRACRSCQILRSDGRNAGFSSSATGVMTPEGSTPRMASRVMENASTDTVPVTSNKRAGENGSRK